MQTLRSTEYLLLTSLPLPSRRGAITLICAWVSFIPLTFAVGATLGAPADKPVPNDPATHLERFNAPALSSAGWRFENGAEREPARDREKKVAGSALPSLDPEKPVAVDLDTDVVGALCLPPTSQATWTLREQNGSGSVELWIYDNHQFRAQPLEKHLGPRWGLLQEDGQILAVGILFAKYLDGRATYTLTNYGERKDWMNVQFLGDCRRSEDWHHWRFELDPTKGLTLYLDGKDVNANHPYLNWNRTGLTGFTGVVLFGDSDAQGQTIWADDVQVTLGGPMQVKPVPPAPPAPLTLPADPVPDAPIALVEPLRHVHPRLLFTAADIPRLRQLAASPAGQSAAKRLSDFAAQSEVPQFPDFLADATEGQIQGLWHAPTVGLHYLLTGDTKSRDKAMGFLKLFLECENWEAGAERDSGMSSANIAIGAALLYDWLYSELTPEFRAQFRSKLLTMARRQYYYGHLNYIKGMGYWQCDPQNNHRWHRDAGLSLCLLAVAEPDKSDDAWLRLKLKEELDFVTRWLPPDGTTHEGNSYLVFGGAHLLLALQAADRCLGSQYLDLPFFKLDPLFAVSMYTPGFRTTFPFGQGGDEPLVGGYAAYLLAHTGHHGLADAQSALFAGYAACREKPWLWLGWMDLLWLNPDLPAGDYHKLPMTSFWPDLGILYVRDSWDTGGVAAMFKCGPLGGYTLNRYRNEKHSCYINVAHDDFDANSLVIHAGGEFMAETDRYSETIRSANHNTILVNNVGQLVQGRLEEGYGYNQPAGAGFDMNTMAVVTGLKDDGDVVIIEGEAAGSYPATATRPALKRFRRLFVWVKGQYILTLDDIAAERAAELTWLLQSGNIETVDEAAGRYRLVKKGANCAVQIVTDRDLEPPESLLQTSPADDRGKMLGWKQLRLWAKTDGLRVAAVFNPWQQKTLAVALSAEEGNDQASVTVTGSGFTHTWTWDRSSEAKVPSTLTAEINGRRRGLTAKDTPPLP